MNIHTLSNKTVVGSSLKRPGVCISPKWNPQMWATTPVWLTTASRGRRCSALLHHWSSEVTVNVLNYRALLLCGPTGSSHYVLSILLNLLSCVASIQKRCGRGARAEKERKKESRCWTKYQEYK